MSPATLQLLAGLLGQVTIGSVPPEAEQAVFDARRELAEALAASQSSPKSVSA